MKQYRHGDVFLKEVKAIPDKAKKLARRGDLILAYGEVTGHAHRISTKEVYMWEQDAQRYVKVETSATLTHEEHGRIDVPAGTYQVLIQRVYSPEEIRSVVD